MYIIWYSYFFYPLKREVRHPLSLTFLLQGSVIGKDPSMSCIFCEIANGNIPSNTIYEDDLVRVILDINPLSCGHALVLPKEHSKSFLETDEAMRNHVFEVAQKMANRLVDVLNADGINILANCNEAAGQTVDHFHVHLIPRYKDNPEKDGFSFVENHIEKPDLDALCAALKTE